MNLWRSMKKIVIEASVLEQPRPSGVNYFTEGLSNALETYTNNEVSVEYLWLNFLGRKHPINKLTQKALKESRLHQVRIIPQRIYAKLVAFGVAPPLFIKKTDWSIFPNFSVWPILPSRKTAVVVHDLCFLRYPEYVEEKNRVFLTRTVASSVKKADLVIAVSEFTKSELIKLLEVPASKIFVVDIPVNGAQFSDDLNKGSEYLKSTFGIRKKYILGISTLEPRKNFETLVNAYCLMSERVRESHSLVIAGGWGWKSEKLRKLIDDKLREGFDIILTGHVSNMDRVSLFKNATVLGFPSHYEGFGMPVLEAFYCGIPVVAADIPVLREVGVDACEWSERDDKSFSLALQRVLTNSTRQKKLIEKGVMRVADFSWEYTAKKLAAKLREDMK